jgi:rare lipoprotein A
MPLLLIQNDSKASESQAGAGGAAHDGTTAASHRGAPSWKLAANTKAQAAGSTPGTVSQATALPMTAPTSTTLPTPPPTSSPRAQEVSQRVVPTTTTTVTAPPTTTTTAPPVAVAAAGSVHYGQVTYYAHPAGRCASPFLAFGTVVRVTNPANGASASCVVDDREADTARSIDLATATFAELAPLSQGVIDAQLSW